MHVVVSRSCTGTREICFGLGIPKNMNQLKMARSDFCQVENCWPQLRNIHCTLARPNVNLGAVSLDFWLCKGRLRIVSYHVTNRADEIPRTTVEENQYCQLYSEPTALLLGCHVLLLKAGIALARMKATTQKKVPHPSHTPHVRRVFSVSLALDLIIVSITT